MKLSNQTISLSDLIVAFLLLIYLTPVLTGCRHSNEASTSGHIYESTSGLTAKFDSLTAGYDKWDGIKIPFSAHIDGMKVSLSGTAYLVRDSVIYLSARFLGMEVGVLSLTSESITVIDKVHRIYLIEPVDSIIGLFPLTIGNIQNLLIGHCFIPGDNAASGGKKLRENMSLNYESGMLEASPRRLKGLLSSLSCSFVFDNSSLSRFTASMSGKTVSALYGNAESIATVPELLVSSSVTVKVPSGRKDYGAEIKWAARKADIITSVPDIKIPTDCRRVTPDQLIRQLSSI